MNGLGIHEMPLNKHKLIIHFLEQQSYHNRIERIQTISNISNCIIFKNTVTVKGISVVVYEMLQKKKFEHRSKKMP